MIGTERAESPFSKPQKGEVPKNCEDSSVWRGPKEGKFLVKIFLFLFGGGG